MRGAMALRCFSCSYFYRHTVGGWTHDDPSSSVEQFCPEYNEWRRAAALINCRGGVAVATLDGKIYAVGGEDAVRCYSNVER